ncbi:MAG: FecR domain-containing protein [Bacteroidales bacterium]|nr:FecR domain-containing protein [Bacteroidales bacterium]
MEKNTNSEVLKELSWAYFEGTATREQEARLFELVSSDKRNRSLFRELESEWLSSHVRTAIESEAYSRIVSRMGKSACPSIFGRRSLRAALAFGFASFVLLVGLGVAFLVKELRPEPVEYFSFSSQKGSTSTLTLADGTKVVLGSDSKLLYGSDFTPENRTASLEGDAYFEVAKDPEHPFTISFGDCSICVRGTKFSVSAPVGAECVRATLIEGAIDFTAGGETRKVLPGEMVRYRKSSGSFETRHVNPDAYLALMEGKVEYYNVTISELSGYLEDIYGKNIHLDQKLSSSKLTVSMRLSNREDFEDVVSALKLMVPMGIRYEGDNVWLTAK